MNKRRIVTLSALLAAGIPLFGTAEAQQAAPAAAPARTSPVAPRKEQIQAIITEAYNKYKGGTRGKNGD